MTCATVHTCISAPLNAAEGHASSPETIQQPVWDGTRWLSLEEVLSPDSTFDLGKSNIITAVRMPLAKPGETFASFKVILLKAHAEA